LSMNFVLLLMITNSWNAFSTATIYTKFFLSVNHKLCIEIYTP
jgi:hypothetical protein